MAVWKKKNDGYLDLSERMRKQQERIDNIQSDFVPSTQSSNPSPSSSGSGFFGGFFGGGSTTSPSVERPEIGESVNPEERKRKLAKRLLDMTNRLEDLENQIYQLKNKVEVLEKKDRVGY